jgi:hypothetical protein
VKNYPIARPRKARSAGNVLREEPQSDLLRPIFLGWRFASVKLRNCAGHPGGPGLHSCKKSIGKMRTICRVVPGFRDGLGDTTTWNNSRLRLDVFSAALSGPTRPSYSQIREMKMACMWPCFLSGTKPRTPAWDVGKSRACPVPGSAAGIQ